jgi:hypothetical protein
MFSFIARFTAIQIQSSILRQNSSAKGREILLKLKINHFSKRALFFERQSTAETINSAYTLTEL